MLKASDLKKLGEARERLAELQEKLAAPEVVTDQDAYQKFAREFAAITPVVDDYAAYEKTLAQINDAKHILDAETDKDLRDMARTELVDLENRVNELETRIIDHFNPQSKEDDRDCIMEIRAGTGGSEASIFAADLYRMYSKYAASKGWKIEPIEYNESDKGVKEVIFSVLGQKVWKHLKWESGTHRVQRVPETEASGRIHTSAATVAVLSEAEEVDVQIDPKDLKVDVYRASGPGGQGVNTADSAVRITHLPTGIVVTCQDERSQLKNKAKAMRVLRARLLDNIKQEQMTKEAATRKAQVGSGDRSEKIRTYNFPDHRVTDHRIGFTIHQLPAVMEGEIQPLIEALWKAEEELKNQM